MSLPKRIKKFAATGLLALSTATLVWAQDISVKLDGRMLQFDQPPARVGGRMMVPLRGIFEALKADVVYDGATRSIQATKDSRVIQLQLGSRTAIIDGRTLFLDVPADTIGGRTMVPLRFVAEALGAEVKWDGPNKTVLMSSGGGQVATTPPPPTTTPPPPAAGAPEIKQVIHSATKVLKPGDSLDIVVYGDEGGKATFEILGSTNLVALPEVSPGKYQTRWKIPNGLVVEKGVLLAHLRKNGKESAMEAGRQVTVQRGTASTTPQADPWKLSPGSGKVTPNLRPPVSLTFPGVVQSSTIRLFVDGIDFTNQARLQGQRLTWTPTYNLSAANHKVEVQATDIQGKRLSRSWGFRIDPNASNNNTQATGFKASQLRPNQGQSVASRPQIGALFSENLRSVNFSVDGLQISQQPGVQKLQNGVLWTPQYDLSPGQHRATIKAVSQRGQVLTKDWTFVVGQASISNFTFSPTQASAGQQVKVQFTGPPGATASFSVGQVANLAAKEVSSGRYEGVYNVRNTDSGTVNVVAQARTRNGQTYRMTAPNKLNFGSSNKLSVSNLSNGMTITPVFNVQGRGTPGSTVSVLVEYSSSNILGAITGQLKTLRTQATVRTNGSYDVPVDASVVRSGQKMRLTVTDGQSQPVQLVVTRR